jgi:hypothetical protein
VIGFELWDGSRKVAEEWRRAGVSPGHGAKENESERVTR